jgi:hypothetical protein
MLPMCAAGHLLVFLAAPPLRAGVIVPMPSTCDADLYQVLCRDDGVVLGLVMRLPGSHDTYAYAYIATHDDLRRLGACSSQARRRKAAIGT